MTVRRFQIDYGNWVSKRLIYLPAILATIFFVLSYLSLFFLIGSFIFIIPTIYFIYSYFQFSPRGRNLQARIRDLVFDHLIWDGEGKLLDIGCGNGALAIEAAIRYPKARVVGIDYWGGKWDYSRESCLNNAKAASVAQQISFDKASASQLPFEDGFFDVAMSNFVFHEVSDVKDKKEVIKEALRVLKKGGTYIFQDLFLWKRIYGQPDYLLDTIKSWGVDEVELIDTSQQTFIPRALKLPFMLGKIGILYGRK